MGDSHPPEREAFSSNVIRLSIREWCAVLVLGAVAVAIAGPVWQRVVGFDPPSDYRIPYELSEDYWLFHRYCTSAVEEGKTLVFGDSFVWGQYVDRSRTLTASMNRLDGSDRFVNGGLDGAHPLAMRGLVQHHCSGLSEREVILHLNLLWLSSPQADLQAGRSADFNHPGLVPQLLADIPAYREPLSGRIGVVVARHLPSYGWVRHLHLAHFDGTDPGRWALENPYRNPLRRLKLEPAGLHTDAHPEGRVWSSRGRTRSELPWVELDTSLQWQAFRELVEMLRGRGNRVFVLIGPLNEHMLGAASLQAYHEILGGAEAWLRENGVAHLTLATLASELYADLSHPLAEGYALLAEEVQGWSGEVPTSAR